MKYRPIQTVATCLAGTLIVLACGTARADGNEVIISQQVVSDTVAESTAAESTAAESTAADSTAADSGTYVGDLTTAQAGVIGRRYGQPDLFYNYYTQGNANAVNAQMYLSPLPVPPNVGHTYFTYQPFYPEEYLYWHKNKFHNNYDNGRGMNRTRATYFAPPVRQAASNFYWNYLRLPR